MAALLAIAKCNGKRDVLTEWVFHNRVDEGKKAAVGILSRTLPLGLKLDEYKTFGEICDEVRKQTTEGIAHSRYEWILDNENMFVNDVLSVVFETAAGASPMALYTRTIYSDERIRQFDQAFSGIINALVKEDDPRNIAVSDLLR